MKAMLVDENKNLVWSDVPNPVMQEDEVLIEIFAAALNRADLLQRQGKYPSPPGCPEWMGLEVAGVIKEMGSIASVKSRWKVGDPVCALLGGGGYAEMVTVRYDMLMPVPKGLSMEEAAALPEACATSYLNLFIEGGLETGNTVLIHAGASGLASIAIPMAKAFDARVITTVLSDEIVQSIESLGADIIINSTKQNIVEVLEQQLKDGHPIDVAMDCLGGEQLGKCLPFMAYGGRWIVISTLAGITTEISLRPLLTRGIRLMGSMLRNRTADMKARIVHELAERVWPKIEEGKIRVALYKVLPVEKAEEAHGILERSENIGKVVLTMKNIRE